jgi:hypothetical protein
MTAEKHKRVVGDTLLPLNRIIRLGPNRDPVDLSTFGAVKFEIEYDSGTSLLAATATGVTIHPTQTFTLDSTNNWVYGAAHGYNVGDVFVPATTGSLSGTGLTVATRYKIVSRDIDWFKVSLTSGGNPITIAGAGTGTHTGYVVGSVQYDFSVTAAGTVGNFRGWFTGVTSTEIATFPDDEYGIPIEISAKGN